MPLLFDWAELMIVNVISRPGLFSGYSRTVHPAVRLGLLMYTVVYYLFDMFYKQWQLGRLRPAPSVLFVIVLIFHCLRSSVGTSGRVLRYRHENCQKSFAYLVLILGALIMVLPFFWMIISSLKTAAGVNTTPPTFWPKELVFENYVYAFEKAPFLRYFCNSLLVTIVCVACTMFTTILAAFAFSRLKFPGRDLLFSLLLSLMMIPFEMLIITNYTTIVKLGLNDTLIALILPFTSSIFYTYILRNFFLAIPDSLYYSARVDGAR